MKHQNRINSSVDGHFNFLPNTPGPNPNPRPTALVDALEILAPSAAQDRKLIAKLYVLSNASPGQLSSNIQDIKAYLRRSLKASERKNLGIILTILDGIEELMEHYKFQSPEDLDAYLEAQQEMFACHLLKNGGDGKAGRAGKTF